MSEVTWITGPLSWETVSGYRDDPDTLRELSHVDGIHPSGAYVSCDTPLEEIQTWVANNIYCPFSVHAVVSVVTYKYRIERSIQGLVVVFEDEDDHVMFNLRF